MASGPQSGNADRSRNSNSTQDAMSTLTAVKSKPRDPPPALFLHPSPAASHVSLPSILAPGAAISGTSGLRRERSNLDPGPSLRPEAAAPQDSQRPNRPLRSLETRRHSDRTDALWAEMQATLEEVELSASGGTHVFGPEHDAKLAELRTAQIALAQAWARSEADDTIETTLRENASSVAGDELRNLKAGLANQSASGTGDGAEASKSGAATNSARPRSSGGGAEQLGAKLEEETEVDILLARKRREANDQYFQRVSSSVVNVVAKLEDVAVAMRAVERESRDIWNENASVSTDTTT